MVSRPACWSWKYLVISGLSILFVFMFSSLFPAASNSAKSVPRVEVGSFSACMDKGLLIYNNGDCIGSTIQYNDCTCGFCMIECFKMLSSLHPLGMFFFVTWFFGPLANLPGDDPKLHFSIIRIPPAPGRHLEVSQCGALPGLVWVDPRAMHLLLAPAIFALNVKSSKMYIVSIWENEHKTKAPT